MASPESTGRIGGAPRPSGGGGVKNLLAMFEKGSSAPASPGIQPSRELSPGPKPLSRVRTSFVAIGGKDGQAGFGLQKIPTSPSSPAGDATLAAPFSPGPLANESFATAATEKPEASKPKAVEEPTKKDVTVIPPVSANIEERKSEDATPAPDPAPTPAPKAEVVKVAPQIEKPSITQENKPPKPEPEQTKSAPPKEPVKEKVTTKEPPKKEKPAAKPEQKPVPSGSKSQPQTKPTLASKPPAAKSLTVPTSGSRTKTPSPLPSPRGHVRKPSASMDPAPKPKPRSSSPAKAPPKPRQQTVITPKPRAPMAPIAHKPFVKPDPKEATKPAELKGSAFAPTASWVAKQGGLVLENAHTRRPPSAAAPARNRSTDRTLRRQRSTLSDHAGSRPSTAAAHNSSMSSSNGPPPPIPSSDFLTRMMRPTKSSASKVHEKVETKLFQPALRAGSAMGRNSEEPQSPPRVKRAIRVTSPKRTIRDAPLFRVEPEERAGAESPTPHETNQTVAETAQTEHSDPESIPEEEEGEENKGVRDEDEEEERKHAFQQASTHETVVEEPSEQDEMPPSPERKAPELTISTTESGEDVQHTYVKEDDDGLEDEGHTPTTTSSSATLVQDGDAPDTTKDG
ncbi:hypothetical protein K440DRAFT_93259 [Wilcoxina mikolae CBS 423.85]|nr:hypothetical protein K440DRAFT_93259 [Wilcoxina mikolae CBS 423.85]